MTMEFAGSASFPTSAGRDVGGVTARADRSGVAVHVGAAAAVLSGALIVGQQLWDAVVPGVTQEGVGESAVHCAWLLLMVFGVLGVYLHQRDAVGRFGDIAALLALLGVVTLFAVSLPEVILAREIEAAIVNDPSLESSPPGVMIVIFLGSFVLYLVGLVLFGVATFRARILPRKAAALLSLSIVFALGVQAAAPTAPGVLVPLGMAFVWLGWATLRGAGRQGVAARR